MGKATSKATILDEFRKHNDEMFALIGKDYALATHKRYETARFHTTAFINYKYGTDDLEMRELDYDFIIA